ncbi:phosphoserine aminotransferase-like [Latimeria chalumnae]|uniref:phosphoserine aminotransferase-like n=1 Tax=Latimeria chalumnae TaxID=7897 RepID=UPI00313C3EDE
MIDTFGVIFASAENNIGCTGVTVVIVQENLLGFALKECPAVLDYTLQVGNYSVYNIPPFFSIYIMDLVLQWVKNSGGVEAMKKLNVAKSKVIYDAIEESNGFYVCQVEVKCRSKMNILFRITKGDNGTLEKTFLQEASDLGMMSLKDLGSAGGIMVSLSNSVTKEEVQTLVELMKKFMESNE